MTETIGQIALISAGCGGMGFGLAAVIRAWFNGRATLIRAQRGEAAPIVERSALPGILKIGGNASKSTEDS